VACCPGYHAGIIRTLLYEVIDEVAYNVTVADITMAITDVLNSLTGAPQLKFTLVNDQGASLANVDSTGQRPDPKPAASQFSVNKLKQPQFWVVGPRRGHPQT
jgi:hypothetical protein